jgi:uncharacterized membrane protein YccC
MSDHAPLSTAIRDAVRIDRTQISLRIAARNTVGIVGPLALGAATGHLGAGLAVTIGALNVAFSDRPGADPSKIERMLIASLIGAVSVFVGSVTGNDPVLYVTLVAIWGLLGGMLVALGPAAGQVGITGIALLLVMSSQPSDPPRALGLAGLALLGGLLQTLLAALTGHWLHLRRTRPSQWGAEAHASLATLRANLSWQSAACQHAIRMAVVLALADALARVAGLPRGYWVPLTVAIILRPDFATTFSRGVARLVGTGLGLVIATGLVHWLFGGMWERIVLVGVLAFAVRLIGPANFGLAAVPLTGLVVVLLSLAGAPPGETIVDRGIDTALGGALALAAFLLWPTGIRILQPRKAAQADRPEDGAREGPETGQLGR